MTHFPVVVIGAGYAGLIAAQRLRAANIPFQVYEASSSVAGLATTFSDVDGYIYDFGTHLITNRLAKTLGVEHICRDVRYFGESVYIRGKSYSYPYGLAAVPRYSFGALRTKLLARDCEPIDASTWAEAKMGSILAREVAIPLMEALTGAPANELAPSVGNKLPGIRRTLMLRAAGRLARKAVAIGYCQDLPEHANVWHVYPKGGISAICHHLVKDLEHNVKLNNPVQKILVDNNTVKGIQVADKFISAQAVISTAPVNVLPKIVQGTERLNYLSDFHYSNAIFVNLFLRGRNIMPNVATWFPESQFDFFRVQEPPISLPWTASEGCTYLTVDIGCHVGDHLWNSPDHVLADRCLTQLEVLIPDIRQRYLEAKVLRTKNAYPVHMTRYERERKAFANDTGIKGLYSVGRNGEFAHILMEDVYHRTVRRVDEALLELDLSEHSSFKLS